MQSVVDQEFLRQEYQLRGTSTYHLAKFPKNVFFNKVETDKRNPQPCFPNCQCLFFCMKIVGEKEASYKTNVPLQVSKGYKLSVYFSKS